MPYGVLLPVLVPTPEINGPGRLPALASLENCGPALALRYCLMHPWMGQMPWLHRGNGRIAGGLGMLFRHQR